MKHPQPASSAGYSCPTPDHGSRSPRVLMGHGGGGLLTQELIRSVFLEAFGLLAEGLADAAVLEPAAGRLAFTTDAFVVRPLFFPGGSIGELAVNGTVNDLAMVAAMPRYLAASFVIEEGLAIADLMRIAQGMAAAAAEAGVRIVAGDTKVVERGHGDGVYITTSGIGHVPAGILLSPDRVAAGDIVLVSGTIGDHGMAIMKVRENLGFEADITSDTAALHTLVADILRCCTATRLLRDPTRGGLATCLNEVADQARLGLEIDEQTVPIAAAVAAGCEVLGLDVWQIANEGKLVAIVPASHAEDVLRVMRDHPHGRQAAVIGRVVGDHPGRVVVRTAIGGRRVVPMPVGELLPRIC
jgi:hydrogenase expression/formation protein HypE